MRAACLVLSVVAALAPEAVAHASPAQVRAPMGTFQAERYDIAASCLMAAMAAGDATAWRMVYPAPRSEALVMLWPRGLIGGKPVVTFHVRQDRAGNISVRYSGAATGNLGALVDAAVMHCRY